MVKINTKSINGSIVQLSTIGQFSSASNLTHITPQKATPDQVEVTLRVFAADSGIGQLEKFAWLEKDYKNLGPVIFKALFDKTANPNLVKLVYLPENNQLIDAIFIDTN